MKKESKKEEKSEMKMVKRAYITKERKEGKSSSSKKKGNYK